MKTYKKTQDRIVIKVTILMVVLIGLPISMFMTMGLPLIKEKMINNYVNSAINQSEIIDEVLIQYFDELKTDLENIINVTELDIVKEFSFNYKNNIEDSFVSRENVNNELISYYDYLKGICTNKNRIRAVNISFEDGKFFSIFENRIPAQYDPTKRMFYQLAISNPNNIVITEPYYSASDNNGIVSLSKAIVENGVLKGVVTIDSRLDIISETLFNTKIGEGGFVMITDNDGVIISDPINVNNNFKNIENVIPKYNSHRNLLSDYEELNYNGHKYLVLTHVSEVKNWKMISLANKEELLGSIYSVEYIMYIIILVSLAASIIITLIMLRVLWVPINEIMNVIGSIKNGNYSLKTSYNKKDFLGKIARSLNEMSESIRNHNKEIKKIAYTDKVLEIGNKYAFVNNFKDYKERYENIDVIYIDIDNFKEFNELYSTEIGDEILEEIVNLVGIIISKESIYRIEGDKFAIILCSSYKKSIYNVIKNLTISLKEKINIKNNLYNITISVSLIRECRDLTAPEVLLNLEQTMIECKKMGGAVFLEYNENIKLKIRRRYIIQEKLKDAVIKKSFKVVYQPIFSIKENRFIKAEALVRLIDEDLGFISPAEFIPIAEEMGVINEVGLIVLEKTCLLIKQLQNSEIEFACINVNVSVLQLMNNDFYNRVCEIIKFYDIDSSKLQFEITETVMLSSIESIVIVISKLKKIGILFAIDDFGTGYSSLNYLISLPLDTLKIDKSLIDNLSKSSSNLKLINNIIRLSKELNLTVVAEGIEFKEQLDALKNLNCDLIQGYYFSKPLCEQEFINIMKNQEKENNDLYSYAFI